MFWEKEHSVRFLGAKILATSCLSMDVEKLRKSFSYNEQCLRRWEGVRPLRKLAIQGKTIIQSESGESNPPPSLGVISRNYDLLKGYTSHMAKEGIICTRLLKPLEPPVKAFYEMMERDVASDQGISMCHQVAKCVKNMLGSIRPKWKKWEMPRAPQL